MSHRALRSLCALALFVGYAPRLAAQCTPAWGPATTLPAPAVTIGAYGPMETFDDGSGPKLYVSNVAYPGGSGGVAAWDGTNWTFPFSGLNSIVNDMAVFDDGSGPALYVAGHFSAPFPRIAKWNGTALQGVGAGFDSEVYSLTVHETASGTELYACGAFHFSGGQPMSSIASWNGTAWTSAGWGSPWIDVVYSSKAFGAAQLFAAGSTYGVGGKDIRQLVNGVWTTIGSNGNYISTFQDFDDGNGPQLYVGGGFASFSPITATNLVRWNGATWSAAPGSPTGSGVTQMTVFDDGGGPALFRTGSQSNSTFDVWKWDGTTWTAMTPAGFNGFFFGQYQQGAVAKLLVAGRSTTANVPKYAVLEPAGPPHFVAQPSDRTIVAGSTLQLQAAIVGTAPTSFVWRRNGVPLYGASGPTFTVPTASPSDAGTYDVVAYNRCGAATSTPAVVTVTSPGPFIVGAAGAQPGTTADYALSMPPSAAYVFDVSPAGATPGIPLGGGFVVPLNPPLLNVSTGFTYPGFVNFVGSANPLGSALAQIALPAGLLPVGLTLTTSFAVIDPLSPYFVSAVAPPFTTEILGPAPTVAGVAPSSGSVQGGAVVTVSGSGFSSGARAYFNGVPGAGAVVTATALVCTAPSMPPGPVDVVVVNDDGQTAVAVAGFTFTTP